MDPQSKILTLEQADRWIETERASGRRIGFTCGSFDLMHPGHVQYLAKARALCDRLLVAVNTDDSVRRYKSPLRPINPEASRMYVVAGLESVDAVVPLDEDRPLSLIQRWKPDLYIKGGDYAPEKLRSGNTVRAYGGRVEVIRPEWESSSTSVIDRIAALALHAAPDPAPVPATSTLALLDRDGTLIRDVPYLSDPSKVELLPGVADSLRRLQDAGVRLAIVSNQQGIGLGYIAMQDFIAVNQRLLKELSTSGVRISKIYFCPHTMADDCACRKPRTGMIERALRDFRSDPSRTFLIGDADADMEAARAAGIPGIRVGPGANFSAAVDRILGQASYLRSSSSQ